MSNISIDGKEYPLAALSDDAKAQLAALEAVDKKMIETKQLTAMLQTARNSYASRLKELLPDS